MIRPVPICHRTIALGHGQPLGADGNLQTTGTTCMGSKCSAWFGQRAGDYLNGGRRTGLGCCRDFSSVFCDDDLWLDSAAEE